jgi:CRISPR-associated protein Cas1
VAHHAQTRRFAAQVRAPLPMRKRLWQQLIRAKIRAQAAALEELYGTDHGLAALVPKVRSGDPANVEARAARRYWAHLFDDHRFRRNPDNEDENLLLNYGYAVLRAIVGRAVCAAGLHPSIGLHHHNRSNPFCLADDLMEPFRPKVDRAVVEYVSSRPGFQGVEASAKQHLIGELSGRYAIEGQQRTLFDTVARLAGSLADVFLGDAEELDMPDW